MPNELRNKQETRPDMIACENVDKWFGDFQALKGVTATIAEQEVVVVLGPSGSGKSTWIRCINRLEAHQRGTIVVDGVELTNDLRNIEKIRSEVGWSSSNSIFSASHSSRQRNFGTQMGSQNA